MIVDIFFTEPNGFLNFEDILLLLGQIQYSMCFSHRISTDGHVCTVDRVPDSEQKPGARAPTAAASRLRDDGYQTQR